MLSRVAVGFLCLVCSSASAQTQAQSAAWRLADANRDGVLTPDEFRVLIDHMAETGHRPSVMTRRFHVYGFAFGHLDANDDGVISAAELAAEA